jgi:hypothetical protein
MPAAGFGLDLDNLAWALAVAGQEERVEPRVLLGISSNAGALAGALRQLAVACASIPPPEADAYARGWTFSHLFRDSPGGHGELVELGTGKVQLLGPMAVSELAANIAKIVMG